MFVTFGQSYNHYNVKGTLSDIDSYFHYKEEPVRSTLLFLREHIIHFIPGVTEQWRYGMPFYYYRGKMVCYLWVHKKHKCPYLGIVNGKWISHPDLLLEKRAKMKILLIEPEAPIPVETIDNILKMVFGFHLE